MDWDLEVRGNKQCVLERDVLRVLISSDMIHMLHQLLMRRMNSCAH